MTIAAAVPAPARRPNRCAGYFHPVTLLCAVLGLQGFDFTPAASYAPQVPTPQAITGFASGDRFVDHATVLRVAESICGASDRAELHPYGATWEGRPLLLAMVSSERNLARRDEIMAGVARLADPRPPLTSDERRRLLDELPAVVWLSFSVHGNEPSGTEASLPLLYHLAAAEDEATRALLDRVFCVIDPCLNPDGRDRYVNWYRSVRGLQPDRDPQSIEHVEPWPGGRVNHYLFDLNRDWAFLTQRETRARLEWFLRLRPQVHADLHEMSYDSSYFFFPSAPPTHESFPPSVLWWGERFGRQNAAAFDRHGWTYYTGENFDLFYPGYGDSWPSLRGAIGMTYEQGGHSAAGLLVERSDGTELALVDRAAHHFTAALTTLQTAAANREELLADYLRFHEDSLYEGAHGLTREVLLVPGADPGPVEDLVSILMWQGVEVDRATSVVLAERAHRYPDDAGERRRFAEGLYRVRFEQPSMRLAKALLEPHATLFGNEFYDISAWSLPLAFGVDAWWCEDATEGTYERVREITPVGGGVVGAHPPSVGWVVPWDSTRAPRFLDRASRGGLRVLAAQEPFTLDGRRFARGSLFVPTGDGVAARLEATAREVGVVAYATSTGWTEDGPDLGSDNMRPVRAPAIAVAAGPGLSTGSVGALTYLLEQRVQVPFSRVPIDRLARLDLARYDVLILPAGRGRRGEMDDADVDGLRRFVEGGGTLIAMDESAFALCGKSSLVRIDLPPEPDADRSEWKSIEARRQERLDQAVPGSLARVRLDPAHWLAYGYPHDEAVVLMSSTRAFPVEGPGRRLGIFESGAHVSGFLSPENREKLSGKAYLAEVEMGRGRVVLFAGDPTFRGLVRGQSGMLMNAIYQPERTAR